jgi:hypothetical protein
MKKILALLCLLLADNAFAQSFPKPPDVPAYVPVAATYAAGTTPNVLGDGSNAKGGTPPAYAYQLADIATPSRSSWIQTGSYSTPGTPATNYFCAVPSETFNGHGCPEPKFRTHVLDSHTLFDDPIRNYGQPGASHCHTFFGNRYANAYSTYSSLRNKRSSTAAGGQLNATAYWRPCVIVTRSSKQYAVKADFNVVYYNTISDTIAPTVQRIPRGFRYVFGYNMDDPDDTLQKKEIAVANAQPGTSGRYVYRVAAPQGVVGWRCVTTGDFSPYLKTTGGADPFASLPGGTCTSGQIQMTIIASECWDGVNLWSPGGYLHLRQTIIDNLASGDKLICPNGWYRLPQLQIIFTFTEAGFSDYGTWRLSSDDMAATKLNSLPTCTTGYANAPCNDGGGTRTVENGKSFHTDWLGGWDDTTMVTWQTNCLGILGGSPHQCEPSVISSTEALNYGPLPDGTTIVTTSTIGTGSTANMFLTSGTHKGPATIHHHQ